MWVIKKKPRRPGKISQTSLDYFLLYAKDADNWGGTPRLGANIKSTMKTRGNLVDLKIRGLITTVRTGENERWIHFTEKGKAFALEYGIVIE